MRTSLIELTDAEIAEVLKNRNGGNAVAVVEQPVKARKAPKEPKAKREKPKPPVHEHSTLDTATMPTLEGSIEKGDIVEYISKGKGTARAYKVSFVRESQFDDGYYARLDGFLNVNTRFLRRLKAA